MGDSQLQIEVSEGTLATMNFHTSLVMVMLFGAAICQGAKLDSLYGAPGSRGTSNNFGGQNAGHTTGFGTSSGFRGQTTGFTGSTGFQGQGQVNTGFRGILAGFSDNQAGFQTGFQSGVNNNQAGFANNQFANNQVTLGNNQFSSSNVGASTNQFNNQAGFSNNQFNNQAGFSNNQFRNQAGFNNNQFGSSNVDSSTNQVIDAVLSTHAFPGTTSGHSNVRPTSSTFRGTTSGNFNNQNSFRTPNALYSAP